MVHGAIDTATATRLLALSLGHDGPALAAPERSQLTRLRELVEGRLGDDPALRRLRAEAAADPHQVRELTQQRVALSLADALADDPAFGSTLGELVDALRTASTGLTTGGAAAVDPPPAPDEQRLRELEMKAEEAEPAEAFAAARQLVAILGPLADHSPERYLRRAALGWYWYGTAATAEAGPAEAVEPLTTSVRLFQRVADDSDPMSLLRLTQALQELARAHLQLNQDEAAWRALEEARASCQRLAGVDSEVTGEVDARISGLLAEVCQRRGDHRGAVAYAEAAEAGLQAVARTELDSVPDLAAALRVLALSLLHEQRANEAQKKIEDAYYHYRRLSKRLPEVYLGELASVAFQSATILMARGKAARALGTYEHAVDLYARAVPLDPSLGESFRLAVGTVADIFEEAGKYGKAQRIRQRYGV